MNLHPVIVHFPVAFLTVYAILEFLRLQVFIRQLFWFYLKAVLVVVGEIGALVATYTGSTARHELLSSGIGDKSLNLRAVVSLHETWSHLSVVIFGLLAAAYLVQWLNRLAVIDYIPSTFLKSIWKLGTWLQHLLNETALVFVLAIAGLVSITITGALGGLIVYGPNSDPVVHLVYQLFF